MTGINTPGQALDPAVCGPPSAASGGVLTRLVVVKMPLQANIFTPRIKYVRHGKCQEGIENIGRRIIYHGVNVRRTV